MNKAGDMIRESIREYEEYLSTIAHELSEVELAKWRNELETLRRYADEASQPAPTPAEPTPEELALEEFANRLAARQGTFMPDFDALAKRKAELDRRLLDDDRRP
jgi:hypothetical protein